MTGGINILQRSEMPEQELDFREGLWMWRFELRIAETTVSAAGLKQATHLGFKAKFFTLFEGRVGTRQRSLRKKFPYEVSLVLKE